MEKERIKTEREKRMTGNIGNRRISKKLIKNTRGVSGRIMAKK